MDTSKTHQSTGEGVGHIVPFPVLAAVYAGLLVFTWLTVAAGGVNLGQWNLWIALGIALVKATLVTLYFMHLRYDRPLFAVLLICALLFVILFIGLAVMDAVEYQPGLIPPE